MGVIVFMDKRSGNIYGSYKKQGDRDWARSPWHMG